jgi:hypothetical protein
VGIDGEKNKHLKKKNNGTGKRATGREGQPQALRKSRVSLFFLGGTVRMAVGTSPRSTGVDPSDFSARRDVGLGILLGEERVCRWRDAAATAAAVVGVTGGVAT